MKVDYIIVGQGLCGTWLSWYLQQAGKKILVVDEDQPVTASKVASGIINPVTGRRIVRTWRIEELLPFATKAYQDFGQHLNAPLLSQTSILDFHPSHQMREAFEKRLPEEPEYLHKVANADDWMAAFNYHFDVGEIAPCLLVDINMMLHRWRVELKLDNALLDEKFSWDDCKVYDDHVVYKKHTASKIFCCEGVAGFDNPYFKNLPYSHMKGEVIIASISGLPTSHIYKHGFTIVPWKDDLFWIGSSYEWKFDDVLPTALFKERVESFLKYFVKLPYQIVDHLAADRPANMERRPFVGLHPRHSSVGILNGMGTKGCSLAPFFAKQLSEHVTNGSEVYADADVRRFEKILNRNML
jgi:glycine/D-amino acid oxidase-like deaminating enzyme